MVIYRLTTNQTFTANRLKFCGVVVTGLPRPRELLQLGWLITHTEISLHSERYTLLWSAKHFFKCLGFVHGRMHLRSRQLLWRWCELVKVKMRVMMLWILELDFVVVIERRSGNRRRKMPGGTHSLELSGARPKTQVLVLEVLPLTPLSDICGIALRSPGGEESLKAHTLFSEIFRSQNLASIQVDPS